MSDRLRSLQVCLAVCTFRRPELLQQLLRSVYNARLTCDEATITELLIVDNDAEQSARSVLEDVRLSRSVPIRYVAEPERGLVSARNRALNEAVGADLLIFLDDDEWVDENWFVELVGTLIATRAQFVVGPVRPVFPSGAAGIYARSGLFHRAEFPDRHIIEIGNTGNCCIDINWIRKRSMKFASQYNRTGGEDEAFFAEMTRLGAVGRYAARAVVFEPVSHERISVVWLLRRRMRIGANIAFQRISAGNLGVVGRIHFALEGIGRFLLGLVLTLSLLIVAPHRALKYAAASARGVGYLIGALGVNIHEY